MRTIDGPECSSPLHSVSFSTVRCSSIPLRSYIPVLFSQGLIMNDDAPGFVISFLIGRCSLPLLVPCFAACLSLCPIHPLTLSDSRPHDDPLMRVVTGARWGHPLSRSLVAFKRALLTPSLLAQHGRAPRTKRRFFSMFKSL